MRKTKIICTLGPAVASFEKISQLIDAGMNVARLNFSHGTHQDHAQMIEWVKKARQEKGVSLPIMLDTKGPEIRVGKRAKPLPVKTGQKISIFHTVDPSSEELTISPALVLSSLTVGNIVLFDDGYILSKVVEIFADRIVLEILNDGEIKSQKGVNIPGINLPLPSMTAQDIEDIKFGCSQDVDLIAASFIRSAEHVHEIKSLLRQQHKSHILVIAKIENSLGVQHFDKIVEAADGIMIARGDLGVELPIEQVPILQKKMIRKAFSACKPVVTATQMLESMIHNPRPTRAEASDVANAIYDSTSAVMLSGETAAGKYPVETVQKMAQIVEATEADFDYRKFLTEHSLLNLNAVALSIAQGAVKTAYSTGAKAIFAFTITGATARMLSRFRPEMPIIALASNEATYHQLGMNWGVVAVPPVYASNAQEAFAIVSEFAQRKKLVSPGDIVIVTSGTPFGVCGTTNMMMAQRI